MSWNTVKLGDVSEVSSSKRIFAKQYTKVGIPFYRQKEIIGKKNKENITEPLFISTDTYNDIKNRFGVPQKGDLLITAVGVTLGIPYVVDDEEFYFKDGNIIWLKNFSDKIDSNYIYYWLISDTGQKAIWSRTIGSAQPALTIDIIKQFELPVPTYDKQIKIVNVLKKYDDLIENNQKQIKLLEEAAQRLYKEWFVDLHFPGWENTEIVDGVPKGWRKDCVGNIIGSISRTRQIKTSDYQKIGDIPIIDQSREFIAGYTDDKESVVDINIPVIVFGDHTRILKYIQFPFAKGADGTQLIVSKLDEMPQCLLYCGLVNIDLSNFHYARHFKYLKAEEMLIPNREIAMKFERLVNPIFSRIQNLRIITIKATESRDRLLPKLMNGELEV